MSDRRWSMTYFSPSGKSWVLTSQDWIAGLRAGGITGLVGKLNPTTITAIGVPGQTIDGFQVPPAEGSLDLFVRGDGMRSATEVWVELRSELRYRAPLGTLMINSPMGQVSTRLRVSGDLPSPDVDNLHATEKPLRVPVANDSGLWWLEGQHGTGTITVTNHGDVPTWPEIEWVGAGGRVKLPSGATFILPPVQETRRISLEPRRSRYVVDSSGKLDKNLWEKIRGVVLPEGVPEEQSRTYELPEGAILRWKIGVLDPWL